MAEQILPAAQQLVSPLRVTGLTPAGTGVTVSLPAVVRDVAAGHRLRLVVSTTDQAYALPARPAQYVVALSGDSALAVPVVPTTVLGGDGLGALVPWALALVVAAGAVVGAFHRARPAAHPLGRRPCTGRRPARDRGGRGSGTETGSAP